MSDKTDFLLVSFLALTAAQSSLLCGLDVAIIIGAGPFLAQHFVLHDLSSAAALQLSAFRLRIEEFENADCSVLPDLNAKAYGRLRERSKRRDAKEMIAGNRHLGGARPAGITLKLFWR